MTPQEHTYLLAIVLGTLSGVLARLCMLRSDYRNYPAYPHGMVIHLSLGAIAAILAALAVPALLEEELTAVTFLVLCAQQFRDIRSMERDTLMHLEAQALIPRGAAYIEGIAKVFESRNYLVMLASLSVSLAVVLAGWQAGCITAAVMIGAALFCMRGSYIAEIAAVEAGVLHFEQSLLYVDDIVLMNVGDTNAREKILREGVGIVLKPYDDNGRIVLNDMGQRQAILHDVSILTGNQLDTGEQEWTPMARKNMATGALGIFILPNEKDTACVIAAAKRTPILESASYKPLDSAIGRAMAQIVKQKAKQK